MALTLAALLLLLLLLLGLGAAGCSPRELMEGLTSAPAVRRAVLSAAQGEGGQCAQDLQRWEAGLAAGAGWALQMTDSWSSSVSGLMMGNTMDLGNYDECVRVSTVISGRDGTLSGLYVLPAAAIASMPTSTTNISVAVRLAMCFPDSCSSALLLEGLQAVAANLSADGQWNVTVTFPGVSGEVSTFNKSKQRIGVAHWIVLFIFAVLLVTPCIATVVDFQLTSDSKTDAMRRRWRVLLVSSLRSGYRRLVAPAPPGSFASMNGLRVLSAAWVAIGHTWLCIYIVLVLNRNDMDQFRKSMFYVIILNYDMAVDTFLALGGAVCCFSLLKEVKRNPSFNWISYAAHRYLRITPVLAVLYAWASTWFDVLTAGPTVVMFGEQSCGAAWWRMFSYLSDYFLLDSECRFVMHTWYLSVDMKMYLLAPLVVIPLARRPKLGWMLLLFVTLAACLSPAITSVVFGLRHTYEYHMPAAEVPKAKQLLYYPSHARAGPYLVGIIAGWVLFQVKSGAPVLILKPLGTVLLWVASGSLLLVPFLSGFFMIGAEYNLVQSFFFNGFYRTAWGAGVVLLVIACETSGGVLKSFLSWHGFAILSRITFAFYMFHNAALTIHMANLRDADYYSVFNLYFIHVIAILGVGLAVATVVFLFVEQPFSLLEAAMRQPAKKVRGEKDAIGSGDTSGRPNIVSRG